MKGKYALKNCERMFIEIAEHISETVISLEDAENAVDNYTPNSIKEQLDIVRDELLKLQNLVNDKAKFIDDNKENLPRPESRNLYSFKSKLDILITNYFTPSYEGPDDFEFARLAQNGDNLKNLLKKC